MPLLKPKNQENLVTVTAKFPASLKEEVDAYIAFAGLKSMNEFLNKASEWVLAKDKDWKKFQGQ